MSRCMQGSTKAKIKLAKKGGEGPGGTGKGAHPVLSIVIESAAGLYLRLSRPCAARLTRDRLSQSRMGKRLEITQDVFVKVKKLEDVEQLKEPLCPAPDVRRALASLPLRLLSPSPSSLFHLLSDISVLVSSLLSSSATLIV